MIKVKTHLPILCFETHLGEDGARQLFDELAERSVASDSLQTLVDFFAQGNLPSLYSRRWPSQHFKPLRLTEFRRRPYFNSAARALP